MSPHLTKRRVIGYMIYFVLVCMLVLGVSFARYYTQVSGSGTATTAAVAMNSTLDLTSQLQDLEPGETKAIAFEVTNQKGDTISDVAQEYTITLTTTGNLPLNYTLSGNAEPQGSGAVVYTQAKSSGSTRVWSGGNLPHTQAATHHYTLSVEWPSDKAMEQYADEIDWVTLCVEAKQVQPMAEK